MARVTASAPDVPSPWLRGATALLTALPWLNPLSYGPSSSAPTWLASAACALLLWGIASAGFTRALLPVGLACAAAALVLWAGLAHGSLSPELAMLAGGLALGVVAAGVGRNRGLAAGLQAGLLAAASLNALFGLLQYFGISGALPFVNLAPAGEAFGNLRQRNQFATSCWMGAAVLLFGTLRLPRAGSVALIVLFSTASAASHSRTGVVAAAVLLLLAACWPGESRRTRLALWVAAAVAYGAAAVLLPRLFEIATGGQASTLLDRIGASEPCVSRLVLWSNVLRLIALKPIAGWGWGELDYAHFMTLYPGERFCEILDNAHNLPLHLAVELGIPAAVAVCGGALLWAWRQRPWGETAPLRQLAWALLALLLLHSMLEYPLWYGPFQIACGLALGWLLAPGAARPATRPLHSQAGAAALIACAAYAAWDYARVSQVYIQPEDRAALWRDRPLEHMRASWLFGAQAKFADFTLSTLTRENARQLYALGQQVLHYSPEPRVVERVIESAVLAGREDEAVLHLARFRAAFPTEYQAWSQRQRNSPSSLP